MDKTQFHNSLGLSFQKAQVEVTYTFQAFVSTLSEEAEDISPAFSQNTISSRPTVFSFLPLDEKADVNSKSLCIRTGPSITLPTSYFFGLFKGPEKESFVLKHTTDKLSFPCLPRMPCHFVWGQRPIEGRVRKLSDGNDKWTSLHHFYTSLFICDSLDRARTTGLSLQKYLKQTEIRFHRTLSQNSREPSSPTVD